jgi:hypothetical protein
MLLRQYAVAAPEPVLRAVLPDVPAGGTAGPSRPACSQHQVHQMLETIPLLLVVSWSYCSHYRDCGISYEFCSQWCRYGWRIVFLANFY